MFDRLFLGRSCVPPTIFSMIGVASFLSVLYGHLSYDVALRGFLSQKKRLMMVPGGRSMRDAVDVDVL